MKAIAERGMYLSLGVIVGILVSVHIIGNGSTDSGEIEVPIKTSQHLTYEDALIIIDKIELEKDCFRYLLKQVGNDVVFPCSIGSTELYEYESLKSRLEREE